LRFLKKIISFLTITSCCFTGNLYTGAEKLNLTVSVRVGVAGGINIPINNLDSEVKISDVTDALKKRYGNADYDLVYDGQLLNKNFSFSFYNVKNQDVLVAIRTVDLGEMAPNWISLTGDLESFKIRMKMLTTGNRAEVERLNDYRLMRLEGARPKVFNRDVNFLARNQEIFNSRTASKNLQTNIPDSHEMGVDPLPQPFKGD